MNNELAKSGVPGRCPKCSAPLRPDIYFCPYCAEGWRSPTEGLGPTPEPVWDAETRIRLRAAGAYEACLLYLLALFVSSWPHLLLGDQKSLSAWDIFLGSSAVAVVSLWIAFRNFRLVGESFRPQGLVSPWFLVSLGVLVPMLAVNSFYHDLLLKETSVVTDPSIYLLADRDPWVAGLFICVFPAVFEELGFRSYVYPLLQRALTPVWAAIISSALFASLHFSFWSWPYLFSLGLLLAFAATKCRSVFPSMVIHFAHNFAVLFLLPRH